MGAETVYSRLARRIDAAIKAGRFQSRAHFSQAAGEFGASMRRLKHQTKTDPSASLPAHAARAIAALLHCEPSEFISRYSEGTSPHTVHGRILRRMDAAIAAGKYKSRAHFLRQIGLSNAYFTAYERRAKENPNTAPRPDIARLLAETLGAPLEDFINPNVEDEFHAVPQTVHGRLMRHLEAAIKAGNFKHRAAFLREAGVSMGYLVELEKRCKVNPKATMATETAMTMAELLGTSPRIFLEDIDESDVEPPVLDRYAGRAWAIQSARLLELSEIAIQRVLREDPGYDPGRLYWFRRIEELANLQRPASSL